MKSLNHFSIPILGLKEGVHQFNFNIDQGFFKEFENSPIQESNFEVQLTLDKRADMLVLDFDFEGSFRTDCDRCLADINLPIKDSQQLIVKYSEDERDEIQVIYISSEHTELNVARFIYEFICLALPIIKTYNCEDENPRVCNDKVVDFLDKQQDSKESNNPIWDELNKLKDN